MTPTCAARAPRRPSPCAPTPDRAAPSPPGWWCHGSQFDEAVESTARVLSKLPAGDPTDPGTICGPLINARQRQRVEGYIRLAEDEHGTIVTGGGRPDGFDAGFFVEPTLIVGVDNGSRVAQEEIFGPGARGHPPRRGR